MTFNQRKIEVLKLFIEADFIISLMTEPDKSEGIIKRNEAWDQSAKIFNLPNDRSVEELLAEAQVEEIESNTINTIKSFK